MRRAQEILRGDVARTSRAGMAPLSAGVVRSLLGAAAIGAFAVATVHAGTASWSDGDFTTWAYTTLTNNYAAQCDWERKATGGIPESYLEIGLASGTMVGSHYIWAMSWKNDRSWISSRDGLIDNITLQIDMKAIQSLGDGQDLRLLVRQGRNGVYRYYGASIDYTPTGRDTEWRGEVYAAARRADFGEITGRVLDSRQKPDFSAAGAEIWFGFAVGVSNIWVMRTHGFDNWKITIQHNSSTDRSDGDFTAGTWSYDSISNGAPSLSWQRAASGGNPGAYIDIAIASGSDSVDYIWVMSWRNDTSWIPLRDGVIDSVSFEIDTKAIASDGTGHNLKLLIRQAEGDGFRYYGAPMQPWLTPTGTVGSWVTKVYDPAENSDFGEVTGYRFDGTQRPDFSPTGGEMWFGFVVGVSGVGLVREHGYDNWKAKIWYRVPVTGVDDMVQGVLPAGTQGVIQRVWPNPLVSQSSGPRLAFRIVRDADVAIDLLDPAGRAIERLASGRFYTGTHQISWRMRGVASGVYFAVLRMDGSVVDSRKIQVLAR